MTNYTLKDNGNGQYSLHGDVTVNTVPALYSLGLRLFAASESICLNLQAIDVLDSACIALLLEWLKQAKQMQKAIHFQHAPQKLINLIKANDLTSILRIS